MEIIRLEFGEKETIGVMMKGGKVLGYTLELPWRDNQQYISCIPVGIYECKRVKTEKFGDTFQVMNVPNRTEVVFHSVATAKDTKGCIGTGRDVGYKNGDRCVLGGLDAKKIFLQAYKDVDTFLLRISNIREVEDV